MTTPNTPQASVIELPHLFRGMTEESPLPMVYIEGPNHVVRFANPAFCRLVGPDQEQLLGKALADVFPTGQPNDCVSLVDRVFRTRRAESLEEMEHVRQDLPSVYWTYAAWPVSASPLNLSGVVLQVTDSTDAAVSRLQATEISQALILSEIRQHELVETADDLNVRLQRAMQETNHRVKNNLQVIAALVELESDGVNNNPGMLRLQHHVRVLATIHDLLAQQSTIEADFIVIPAEIVVASLLEKLQQTFAGHRIIADVDELLLTSKRSAAMALLINECVSNAVKHGSNDVSVTIRVSDGMTHLEVRDDGPGFPPGFDPVKSANIGLGLVVSVARWDLQGEISFQNGPDGGARVTVEFPVDVPAPTV